MTKNSEPCAKYNTQTQKLEILPEFEKDTNNINEIFNDMISAAQTAKHTIRNTYRHIKAKEEFYNTLKNDGLL